MGIFVSVQTTDSNVMPTVLIEHSNYKWQYIYSTSLFISTIIG
jgi:hypothetical protein